MMIPREQARDAPQPAAPSEIAIGLESKNGGGECHARAIIRGFDCDGGGGADCLLVSLIGSVEEWEGDVGMDIGGPSSCPASLMMKGFHCGNLSQSVRTAQTAVGDWGMVMVVETVGMMDNLFCTRKLRKAKDAKSWRIKNRSSSLLYTFSPPRHCPPDQCPATGKSTTADIPQRWWRSDFGLTRVTQLVAGKVRSGVAGPQAAELIIRRASWRGCKARGWPGGQCAGRGRALLRAESRGLTL